MDSETFLVNVLNSLISVWISQSCFTQNNFLLLSNYGGNVIILLTRKQTRKIWIFLTSITRRFTIKVIRRKKWKNIYCKKSSMDYDPRNEQSIRTMQFGLWPRYSFFALSWCLFSFTRSLGTSGIITWKRRLLQAIATRVLAWSRVTSVEVLDHGGSCLNNIDMPLPNGGCLDLFMRKMKTLWIFSGVCCGAILRYMLVDSFGSQCIYWNTDGYMMAYLGSFLALINISRLFAMSFKVFRWLKRLVLMVIEEYLGVSVEFRGHQMNKVYFLMGTFFLYLGSCYIFGS